MQLRVMLDLVRAFPNMSSNVESLLLTSLEVDARALYFCWNPVDYRRTMLFFRVCNRRQATMDE